jgi:hypothetical protein
MSRLRACCAVHDPVGCAVTPRMCTRRVWISITNKTYSRLRNTVSTCRKSHARSPGAWEARNCCQVGDARRGAGVSPGGSQDPADRSRADAVPEPEELTLDTAVPPSRVLPGQPPDQFADLREFDLVVDGEAAVVTDAATVADMAARCAAEGWPARVDETGLALTAEYSTEVMT